MDSASRLMRLPNDVLRQIINYVDRADGLKHDDWPLVKKDGCIPVPPGPRHDSLKSLALVNRKLHLECNRRLWKTVDISRVYSLWPQGDDIDTAIDALFPIYGSLVQHLILYVEDMWYYAGVDDMYITSANAISIIAHCPNLRSIDVTFLCNERMPKYLPRVRGFFLREVCKLRGLQHLRLYEGHDAPVFNNAMLTRIAKAFPNLESFSMRYAPDAALFRSEPSFLSGLRYLRSLKLQNVSVIPDSWMHSWASELEEVDLNLNYTVLPRVIRQFLHTAAPNLTQLSLSWTQSFNLEQSEPDSGLDSDWDGTEQFDLPALEKLRLCCFRHPLISSFQLCQEIRDLDYACRHIEDARFCQQLVDASTWPHLERVAFGKQYSYLSRTYRH